MRSNRLYLADILDAIEAIERFTSGIDAEGEHKFPRFPGRRSPGFAMWRCMHTLQWLGWGIVFVTTRDDLQLLKRSVAMQLERSK